MDNNNTLFQRFSDSKTEFLAALSSPEFYLAVIIIGVSLGLAWLLSALIQRRLGHYLNAHPIKRIDSEFITKPASLLAPVLAIIYLAALMPLISGGAGIIDAAIRLIFAYLLAKVVLLLVRSRLVAYFIAFTIMLIAVLRVSGFMNETMAYLQSLQFGIGSVKITVLNLANGIIILVVVFWLAGAMSRTLESYMRHNSRLNYSTRELIGKFFRIFIYFLALMITLSATGVDLTAFAVFGGALGVGIGFGLQKIAANFISGITLLIERSIKLGDMIEVGGTLGRVRQLNVRYALIETQDGREILIPNDELISTRVTNWTYSNERARVDIPVTIDYRSDPALAQKLMLEAAISQRIA